jgi:hypothetical protein
MTVKCPNCKEGSLSGKVRKKVAYGRKISYRGSVLKCDTCDHQEVF